ncbi:MAG: hypothetical protein U1F65_01745 [Verrucomicrobiota bacterium]
METLPKGVTGFDAPEKLVSIESFELPCQSLVRRLRGGIVYTRRAYAEVTPNFHEVHVKLSTGESEGISILCNAHFPIVAFAQPVRRPGDLRVRFLDCPYAADDFKKKFTIMTRAEAEAGISPTMILKLGPAELDQMRYWNPTRLGDLVFNFWD